MKSRLALLILVVLVACSLARATAIAPVFINGGFEQGWHRATTYWTPLGGPFHTKFVEIFTPEGYVTWWREGFLCSGHSSLQGRPEVKIISAIPDPTRIHSGDQALQFFTFWRCHRGGVYQQVAVEPGKHYTVQAYGETWFSNCDHRPHHHLPLDYDCTTPITWAQLRLRICVDPLGGIDPTVPSVECSPWEEIYGRYGSPLRLEHILALSDTVTVFTEADASHPLKHDDVYWDDISISESYQVFMPLIVKE